MNIEQLRADMEAGTQGEWWDDPSSTEIVVTLGPHTKYVVADVEDMDDARRIARVPQLERIALAANPLADALSYLIAEEVDYMDNNNLGDPEKQHGVSQGRKALAGYREAIK